MSNPDLIHNVEQYLPRLAFELTNMGYDNARKLATTQKFANLNTITDRANLKYRYETVPYNLTFALHILTKNTEDAFQIIEQIVPYFGPDFVLTFSTIGIDENVDVPISIGSVTIGENYEDDFIERKVFTATIIFTAKINLFGPISTTGIILNSTANFLDFNAIKSPTGATLSSVTVAVTGGATAGSFGPTGTYYTVITEY